MSHVPFFFSFCGITFYVFFIPQIKKKDFILILFACVLSPIQSTEDHQSRKFSLFDMSIFVVIYKLFVVYSRFLYGKILKKKSQIVICFEVIFSKTIKILFICIWCYKTPFFTRAGVCHCVVWFGQIFLFQKCHKLFAGCHVKHDNYIDLI